MYIELREIKKDTRNNRRKCTGSVTRWWIEHKYEKANKA